MTIDTSSELTSERIAAIVESLLFVADEPVTLQQLAAAIQCRPKEVETALDRLQEACQTRGLRLQRLGAKVQLVTAPEAAAYIERFLGLSFSSRLSTPALETLAIIAYRQPVTRPEIEGIRGVNSDGVLRTLLSKGLIEEVGRLETVGRPMLFGTTFQFLQYFGLSDLDQLPPLELPVNQTSQNLPDMERV
ncbi:MAG: SMC-Scp complex subunit ScpB [Anaerolineae bacterium]